MEQRVEQPPAKIYERRAQLRASRANAASQPATEDALADRIAALAGRNMDHLRTNPTPAPLFIRPEQRTEAQQADELLRRFAEDVRLNDLSADETLAQRVRALQITDVPHRPSPPIDSSSTKPRQYRDVPDPKEDVHAILEQAMEEARLERRLNAAGANPDSSDESDYLPAEFLQSLLQHKTKDAATTQTNHPPLAQSRSGHHAGAKAVTADARMLDESKQLLQQSHEMLRQVGLNPAIPVQHQSLGGGPNAPAKSSETKPNRLMMLFGANNSHLSKQRIGTTRQRSNSYSDFDSVNSYSDFDSVNSRDASDDDENTNAMPPGPVHRPLSQQRMGTTQQRSNLYSDSSNSDDDDNHKNAMPPRPVQSSLSTPYAAATDGARLRSKSYSDFDSVNSSDDD
ncbi:hypothetical protein, variant 1 [Capsaspora owczarzaki ATCC 30864]|nr:hypothetical protein, variant 1 [Capsaspora owczarzaki ATCC 30864]